MEQRRTMGCESAVLGRRFLGIVWTLYGLGSYLEPDTFHVADRRKPGWSLFQNYGLQPAPCGPQNLVYIYGPNNSVMCAFPNMYVPAGFYYVDPMTLQLFVM
jgi:hypothetical protein